MAAILTINTAANTLGAAGVGAQAHILWGTSYVTMASVFLTLGILIISEIIPKTIGATYWKQLAPACSFLIVGLIYITYPFVKFAGLIKYLLSRKTPAAITSREEMIETAKIGAFEGTLEHKESQIIYNLLMLTNIKTSEVMTPRSVMMALEIHKL